MIRKRSIAILAVLVLAAGPCAARALAAQATSFTIVGSTAMYTDGALLSNRYMATRPGVQIAVNPTSGLDAFDSACRGEAAIGMSDLFTQDAQLLELGCADMVNIPMAVQGLAVTYNLPGRYLTQRTSDGFTLLHPLRLTAHLLAGIYLCRITRWNDPAIAALNPGVPLPARTIAVLTSNEPNGSGAIFSRWLDRSDASWRNAVGANRSRPGRADGRPQAPEA
jgi:phosphate transport system substrate-binding protein